jgi:hypothetical protein
MNSDLLKGGLSATDQYAAKAQAILAQVDITKFKDQLGIIVKALESGDYSTAQKFAQTLDETLDSDIITRTVGFLEIRAKDGTTAAGLAIDGYLKTANLDAAQKEFFVRLKDGLHAPGTKKVIEFTFLASAIALELKFPHAGGAIVAITRDQLFHPDTGAFKEYGLFREEYEWRKSQNAIAPGKDAAAPASNAGK